MSDSMSDREDLFKLIGSDEDKNVEDGGNAGDDNELQNRTGDELDN